MQDPAMADHGWVEVQYQLAFCDRGSIDVDLLNY